MRLFVALAGLGLAIGASAAGGDLPGWRAARWGMSESAISQAFGDGLRRLPGRQAFGGAYADLALPGIEIGGEPFTAFFQMNAGTDRLQQVMLRGMRRQPSERSRRAILSALRGEYGPESLLCTVPKAGGGELVVEHVWQFPTTTVHVSFLDFYSSAMAFEDPNSDRDPRRPFYERQRNAPSLLPRHTAVRFHPTARTDLLSAQGCRKP